MSERAAYIVVLVPGLSEYPAGVPIRGKIKMIDRGEYFVRDENPGHGPVKHPPSGIQQWRELSPLEVLAAQAGE